MKQLTRSVCVLAFSSVVLLTGCTDFGSEAPPPENLILSVRAAHIHTPPGKIAHQNLVITSVKMILRSADLIRQSSENSIRIMPSDRILDVQLSGEMTTIGAVNVPSDSYLGLNVTIHLPENGAGIGDSEFIDSTDGTKRYSLIVRGEYHETPFVYRSRNNTMIELAFDQPIRFSSGNQTNVTLELDPYAWFNVGQLLLDPFNQGKEIDENLTRTFAHVFRDNDRDGEPD